ncbi:Mov34/MPN/PAD-1 family protein [Haladaptatus sp. F3-133]|jgi:proteasome lid subunit RPN8/RPN11|uniref:Mov34/MPN/PAD-1 family protein n=1 Tax=Halorutilus salinus TaxID=2487751 RepID=A0A9Q4C5X4_9EURY|nr:Mov34/MPN/PAD-1 family protein [Halorutilus salinus]MCX2819539.1 Mov34/MPN/PAD-1 family protein [Halorutilus salinus]
MGLFRSSSVVGIADETLEFVLETCADSHPNEFMGLLRAEEVSSPRLRFDGEEPGSGRVITDVLVIPGTTSGEAMASVREEMVPANVGGVGTVHSHPSGSIRPSEEDLRTFGSKGARHIIVGRPYDRDTWRCYSSEGEGVHLDVLDVDFEEEPFETDGDGFFGRR